MNDSTYINKRYRTICSCCSDYVTKEDRKLPNNNDSEGNLCGSCYEQLSLDAWFEMHEIFDKVYKAMKNSINKLKWRYLSDQRKWHYCTKLMEKGILKWKIG